MDKKQNKKFACPMHCEDDKTYDAPGDCPVCRMHLKPVEDPGNEHHHHKEGNGQMHQPRHHGVHVKTNDSAVDGKYYCPMRCEGDKTHDAPGDCPVCGMHLQKVESNQTSSVTYTCPMHPEIKQKKSGSCPKCGMDLIPEKGEVTSEEEKAYKKMSKKFWIALALSIPVFLIAMSEFLSFLHLESIASKKVWGWVQFVLATPVVFYPSWVFLNGDGLPFAGGLQICGH